ncbi:MAG: hypothetical protein ABI828_05840 [Actinomycetota bacterium]
MTRLRTLTLTLALALLVLSVSCNGTSSSSAPTSSTPDSPSGSSTFSAQVASSDLYVGPPQDFEFGIQHASGQGVELVTFGTVKVHLDFLGDDASGQPQPKGDATATYIAAPGTTPGGPAPTVSNPSDARGVYSAPGMTFDTAGFWQATFTADVSGEGTQTLAAAFTVAAKPVLPAPGQKAIPADNPIIGQKGEPNSAIDSRAQGSTPVPDPELHQITIRQAMAEHRPILAVFSTPVYCISQFCGPTTDAVEALAKTYGNRAVFIHVEIYRKHAANGAVINKAAADWLYRNNNLTEPWLYLIGSDGTILNRWGPLFDPKAVGRELAKLPKMRT